MVGNTGTAKLIDWSELGSSLFCFLVEFPRIRDSPTYLIHAVSNHIGLDNHFAPKLGLHGPVPGAKGQTSGPQNAGRGEEGEHEQNQFTEDGQQNVQPNQMVGYGTVKIWKGKSGLMNKFRKQAPPVWTYPKNTKWWTSTSWRVRWWRWRTTASCRAPIGTDHIVACGRRANTRDRARWRPTICKHWCPVAGRARVDCRGSTSWSPTATTLSGPWRCASARSLVWPRRSNPFQSKTRTSCRASLGEHRGSSEDDGGEDHLVAMNDGWRTVD